MAKKVLTHIDADGRARMVDVSEKSDTVRVAVAEGRVVMSAQTLAAALLGGGKKGDVMAVAEIAGVMAAKRTAELIPMCHPLALSSAKVSVRPTPDGTGLTVTARVKTTGPTGMTIEGVQLVTKSGGASGDWAREA